MKLDKYKIYIILCSMVGTCFTWFINNKMGYGSIIANGLIGVIVATILPSDLAGVTYTASFVGMSSIAVLSSMVVVALGGFIVGILIIATKEIYAGIGGKGGTTAAAATIITTIIQNFFD